MALPVVPLRADELYPSHQLQDLLSLLGWWSEQGGIFLLTGEVGCGKTSALRRFVAQLNPARAHAVSLVPPLPSARALYRAILRSLGETPQGLVADLAAAYVAAVTALAQRGLHLLLVIDEAQDLPLSVLAQLRNLLTAPDGAPLPVALLLSGTQEISQHLHLALLQPVQQRVVSAYHLTALGRDELPTYVSHQLKTAGARAELSSDALTALFEYTRGVPRLVTGVLRLALRQSVERIELPELHKALRAAGYAVTTATAGAST
jgi:type II secretory pathway predicted ATPase ExeA